MIYTYSFEKCQTCGKQFLVERMLIGTEHTASIIVSCKECLKKKGLNKQFAKEHSEEAKAINEWLKVEIAEDD